MGDLYYGSAKTRIHMDDRTLMHLSAVITAKLRRNEPFLLTWRDGDSTADGRSAVWVHQACDLRYVFQEPQLGELDRGLLEQMARSASSAQGLLVDGEAVLEPAEDAAEA